MAPHRLVLLTLLAAAAPLAAADASGATKDLMERWKAINAAAPADSTPFLPPDSAIEWYTVTIANVSVGYMHTSATSTSDAESGARTMEVMDVQVSRGTDTSRMAFETVFEEAPLNAGSAPEVVPKGSERSGGVSVMAYDQRFANSEVRMNASFATDGVTLTSYNGEKAHTSDLPLPDEPWLGRMRARLEFARQCRAGETEIVVQTMRPELGPRVVNLSSTLVDITTVWDGEEHVEASVWSVQISDVPVNMSEAYPVAGPLRCYRMLQMSLDMPFGYLLASLDTEANAMAAAEEDPTRVLPELVYTMFVSLSAPITDVYEASKVELQVRIKGTKGPNSFELPSAGFQHVKPVDGTESELRVTIDLQNPMRASAADRSDKEFTSPSAMVDSSDEVVIALSHQVDEDLKKAGHDTTKKRLPPATQLELVYALRDLVHSHISSKHLSTAYASASETARTGSGDCTEHAVLLAALVKARGLPARVCHGLVYVEQGGSAISGREADAEDPDDDELGERVVQANVGADGSVGGGGADGAGGGGEGEAAATKGQFGWHMWSQAMVNGRWIDLDATLHVPYSVGHVLVGTSSMSDKEAHNNHMQMAALIGNLEIDLLGVSHEWRGRPSV